MDQAFMLPQQSRHTLGTPRLGAAKDGWPRRVKWMYNRHEYLLFRWVEVHDFFLPQLDRRCLRALCGLRARGARWVEFSEADLLHYPTLNTPTPLIGREPELATLARLLRDPQCRMLTLVGLGGIGKTHLALQVAHLHRELFADGVYFVPLAPLISPKSIIPAIADALALTFYGSTDPKTYLLNHPLGWDSQSARGQHLRQVERGRPHASCGAGTESDAHLGEPN
jgi:hypothetical protein